MASPSEIISSLRHLRPSTEFRKAWQYQNQHYVTLSHIIPTLTGVPFVDFVKQHIFGPVGLESATYNHTEAAVSGRRIDGFMRYDRNATECARVFGATGEVDRSCLGQTESFGWWTETDAIFEAGPGGVIMSTKDMVSGPIAQLRPADMSRRNGWRNFFHPKSSLVNSSKKPPPRSPCPSAQRLPRKSD